MRRVVEAVQAVAAQQWAEQWPSVADVRAGRHAPPKWVRICRVEKNEVARTPAVLSADVEWNRLLDTDCVVPAGGEDG